MLMVQHSQRAGLKNESTVIFQDMAKAFDNVGLTPLTKAQNISTQSNLL